MRRFFPFLVSSPLALLAVACGSPGTEDPSLGESTQALSCASYPLFTYKTYVTGDIVKNAGSAYQCTASSPSSQHCGQAGYEPGTSLYWDLVWTRLGTCDAMDASVDAGADAKADAADAKTDAADAKADATDGAADATEAGGDAGPLAPKFVLLQKDFTETVPNEVVNNRVFHPQGVVVDRNATSTADRVYVWDSGNQRILAYKSLGTCSGGTASGTACTNNGECAGGGTCSINPNKAADLVIGQKDANSATCNGDNTKSMPASASTLCPQPYPRAISLLESPEQASMAIDANHNLYVPDKWNHRVLKYVDPLGTPNATTGAGDAVADAVWGQSNFTDRLCNRSAPDALGNPAAPTAGTLCLNEDLTGVHLSGDELGGGVDVSSDGKVWVTDQGNHRVLRFPSTSSANADLVLGQSSFTTRIKDYNDQTPAPEECEVGGPNTGRRLCWPKVVRYNPNTTPPKLYVVDWRGFNGDLYGEYRVLIYDKPATGDFTNGMAATEAIVGRNEPNGAPVQKWRRPTGLEIFPLTSTNSFWLSDSAWSRALFYTKASGTWTATKVLSQANLTEVEPRDVRCPTGVNSDCNVDNPGGGMGIDSAGNIYMGEAGWPRVLRFTGTPPNAPTGEGTGAATPANAILFPNQPGLDGHVNVNKVSGKRGFSLNNVLLVKYAAGTTPATQLLVFDQYRGLFWNSYSAKTSGAVADGALYQPDVNSHTSSVGHTLYGLTASPNGSKIFVGVGSRIDVFDGPLTNNETPTSLPTDLPLRKGGSTGQIDVAGLAYDAAKDVLWIADGRGHRILRLSKPLSTVAGERKVDMVLGQPHVGALEANRSKDLHDGFDCLTVQPDGFGSITGIRLDKSGNLYVIDGSHEGKWCSNNRALEWDAASLTPDANRDFFCLASELPTGAAACAAPRPAKRVYGPANFTTKGIYQKGPENIPNTPISVSFDANNHMIMTVDGYGNPQDKRMFYYANPVPTCTAPGGCAVAPTSIFPIKAAQATDSSFDPDGNLVVMDQTWLRLLYFGGSDVASWMQRQ